MQFLETEEPEADPSSSPSSPKEEQHEACYGLGVLLSVDSQGMIAVAKVQRPGPADGKLWGGDVVYEVNGESLIGLQPGLAMCKVLGLDEAGQEDGHVQLGVMRTDERICETVYRRLPPPRGRFSAESVTKKRKARGRITVTDVCKMLRMLLVVPRIVGDDELAILIDSVSFLYMCLRVFVCGYVCVYRIVCVYARVYINVY
jgi:hypothetical protein